MVSQNPNARRRPDELKKIKEAQVFALVLGNVIETLRRQRAWTQAQLAASIGVSQPVLSRIEAGKLQPDAFLYGKLATTFGKSVQDLDRQVNDAIQATRRAAEAVSGPRKSSDEVFAFVGAVALIGLIGFAVAALVDGGGVKIPKPKV